MELMPTAPMVTANKHEEQLLISFRAMNQQAQDKYLMRMASSAIRSPSHVKPGLKLVVGGAQ